MFAAAQAAPEPTGDPVSKLDGISMLDFSRTSGKVDLVHALAQVYDGRRRHSCRKSQDRCVHQMHCRVTFQTRFPASLWATGAKGTGFVVYSVGPDGTFDGGHVGDKMPPNQAAFAYPAPDPVPVPQDATS